MGLCILASLKKKTKKYFSIYIFQEEQTRFAPGWQSAGPLGPAGEDPAPARQEEGEVLAGLDLLDLDARGEIDALKKKKNKNRLCSMTCGIDKIYKIYRLDTKRVFLKGTKDHLNEKKRSQRIPPRREILLGSDRA